VSGSKGRGVSGRLTPLRIDEEIDGVVGVAHDVTELRERERQFEAKNERLDSFASIVSHDLRNPLNVAGGHVELARRECDSEHLATVADAHERMSELIDELLTLARTDVVVSEREPVELAAAADSAWNYVSTAEATLVVETDLKVHADPNRLEQLLENSFPNAVEHGGEAVTVTVGRLPGGFYIADDGVGVSEPDRGDIFDAGYTTSEAGTGFGLKIVDGIAAAHDWTVSLTESEHGGARFEVTGV